MIANPPQTGQRGQNSEPNQGFNSSKKGGVRTYSQFFENVRHEGVAEIAVHGEQNVGKDEQR